MANSIGPSSSPIPIQQRPHSANFSASDRSAAFSLADRVTLAFDTKVRLSTSPDDSTKPKLRSEGTLRIEDINTPN